MKTHRPIYLDLMAYRFPLAAIGSVLHRISGVLLFILMPWVVSLLAASLSSEQAYSHVQHTLHGVAGRFAMWVFLASLAYHLCAGLRHIAMDFGLGETLEAARYSTLVVLLVSAVLVVLAGVWLW